jgi:hypothetical protein
MIGSLKNKVRGHLVNDKARQNAASTMNAEGEQIY